MKAAHRRPKKQQVRKLAPKFMGPYEIPQVVISDKHDVFPSGSNWIPSTICTSAPASAGENRRARSQAILRFPRVTPASCSDYRGYGHTRRTTLLQGAR